ncbi:MAG TPA: hypothetical protein VF763_02420 [Candidatus Limnocylindrales bacterium]
MRSAAVKPVLAALVVLAATGCGATMEAGPQGPSPGFRIIVFNRTAADVQLEYEASGEHMGMGSGATVGACHIGVLDVTRLAAWTLKADGRLVADAAAARGLGLAPAGSAEASLLVDVDANGTHLRSATPGRLEVADGAPLAACSTAPAKS